MVHDSLDIRRDSELFLLGTQTAEFQARTLSAMKGGFQTPEGELDLAGMLSGLAGNAIAVGAVYTDRR